MFIQQGHHTTTVLMDPNLQKAQQPTGGSPIAYLSPQKTQQLLHKAMDNTIHDAAHGPSSSQNNLLTHLAALRERGYQNAPGSNLKLSYKGGLLGGSGKGKEKMTEKDLKREEKLDQYGRWGSQQLEQSYERSVTRRAPYEREETHNKGGILDRMPKQAREDFRRQLKNSGSASNPDAPSVDLSATHTQDEDGFWIKKQED